MSNDLGSDQAQPLCGPDLVPNHLQRLSADNTNRQQINPYKSSVHFMGQEQTVQTQIRRHTKKTISAQRKYFYCLKEIVNCYPTIFKFEMDTSNSYQKNGGKFHLA